MRRIREENINTLEHWDAEHARRVQEKAPRFELVADLIRRSGGKRVLDIGCGGGELLGYLKKRGIGTVFFGTDFSEVAIEKCKGLYPDAQWAAADLSSQPFDDKHFDVVVSCEVLEHLEDPSVLAKEMMRLAKDDGTIILTTPLQNRVVSSEHLWEFEEQDIRDLFEGWRVRFVRVFPELIVAYITKS